MLQNRMLYLNFQDDMRKSWKGLNVQGVLASHGQHQFCRTINSQQRCDQNDNSCAVCQSSIQIAF